MFGHWSSPVRQVALEVLTHFNIPVNNMNNNNETAVSPFFTLILGR